MSTLIAIGAAVAVLTGIGAGIGLSLIHIYMSVPNNASYRAMEPVASNWQQHNKLGDSLITGLKNAGNKIFSGGSMEMDLTQTSFSTIPSIDIELGDKEMCIRDRTWYPGL